MDALEGERVGLAGLIARWGFDSCIGSMDAGRFYFYSVFNVSC
jgi:uncharacterized protein (UPF0128 family)